MQQLANYNDERKLTKIHKKFSKSTYTECLNPWLYLDLTFPDNN